MSKNEWARKFAENEKDGSCTVRGRLGKAGSRCVKWGRWQTIELHLQKNQNGEVVLVTPKSPLWAEYDPRQYDLTVLGDGNALFIAEDWYMEVSEFINEATPQQTR